MARFKKEKGGPRRTSSTSKAKPVPKKSTKENSDSLLREQVLALGGTQDDLELLKDVNNNDKGGEATVDPTLSGDISKFLKGLKFDDNESQQAEKQSSKKFEKSTKKGKKSDKTQTQVEPTKEPEIPQKSKKQKKDKIQGVAEPIVSKPEPSIETPKVQLPAKVTFDPKSKFVFPPTALWHTVLPPLPPPPPKKDPLPSPTPTQITALTSKATSLHHTDTLTFQTSSNSSPSEASFLSKIIQSGTLSDRLSALTLLVQSSPVHNVKALEVLRGMAERGKGKGGRDESLKALRCVVDWWVGGGAPDRKLKYFRDQPLTHDSITDEYLLSWYFEDWLKKYFFSILEILESLSLDPLPYVRTQALTLIFTLLRDKPEQEQNLLRLLVNKLGDTEKTLCSRASYHLLQLMQSHPSMKGVIVREIISLVLRPAAPPPLPPTGLPTGTGKHIRFTDSDSKPKPKAKPAPAEKKAGNAHARYYATITFNQIVLTPGDRDVSLKLIDVYFEMFKELLGEGKEDGGDDDGEVGGDVEEGEKEVVKDKKGRVRDKGKGKGKKQGVTEVKGAAGFTEVEDAQSRLISAILTGVNRALPFAKIDAGDVGLNKHIDTLFLITHTSTFNISLQALVLIQQITASLMPSASTSTSSSSTSKSITDRYYRTLYASLHDPRLATSSKQAMYLNLLFKSIKADAGNHEGERVKAVVRRFVQVLVSGGGGATEFTAGGLFLLGELFSTIPGLRTMINQGKKSDTDTYDPRKRDPQFAHASSSPLWELTPLLHHYHPAVSLHARQLLSSQPLTASADLSQNTLSHFLDRFVYKNPKKAKSSENAIGSGKSKGASAMQPAASGIGESGGVKLMKGEVDDNGLMNEEAFLRKRVEDVPVDQLFFHKFFSQKKEKERAIAGKAGKGKGESGDEDEDEDEEGENNEDGDVEESVGSDVGDNAPEGSDADEDDSDMDEAEIWKAMKASMPQAAGDDDLLEDSDDLPSDFDQEFSSDEDDGSEHQVDDDDALSLVEGSGDEDLVSLDGDIPDGLIDYDGSDEDGDGDEEEEWGGIGGDDSSKKRKREDSSREKRKKLRSLPTFASYEDYAKMIEDGPEDDI